MTRYEIADCPSCGGTEHTEIAVSDAIRDELEQLWAFHTRRLCGDTPPERVRSFFCTPPSKLGATDPCGGRIA